MRRVDLCHGDTNTIEGLPEIRSVMHAIEAGKREPEFFRIYNPDGGPEILEAVCVTIEDADSNAWAIHRESGTEREFVASGERADYYPCMFLGSPGLLRADCLFDRDEAISFLEQVIEGQAPLKYRWISCTHAMRR